MTEETSIWNKAIPSEPNRYNWTGKPILSNRSQEATELPKVVDLFSGCGGLSTGFEEAGFETLLGIDIHQPSIETFRRNHPRAKTILGDITLVDEALLDCAIENAQVDVVVGGAPCQGFSICNRKQYDEDPRNLLFLQYMRVIEHIRPTYAVFENVATIKSAASGWFAEMIEQHFIDLGYNVRSGPVNAIDFAVPQRRVRWIFVASLPGVPIPNVAPYKTTAVLTAEDAIGDLPALAAGEEATSYAHEPTRPYQIEMRGDTAVLLNHEAPNHPQATINRIANTLPGMPMYESFKQRIRLDPNKPSPTIVSGGIRPQFSLGHPRDARGLTVRELCRIQSFPDHFEVLGGIVQGRVQIGNAVPPRLARAFGNAIMASMQQQLIA